MSGKHRASNVIDSDSDDYWDHLEDRDHEEFWAEAGELADSASNSPVKGNTLSFPMTPETPRTSRLADSLDSLAVRSGGALRTKGSEANLSVSLNEEDPFISSAVSHTSVPRIIAPNRAGGSLASRAYGGMPPPPITASSKRSTSKIQLEAAARRAATTDYHKSYQGSRSGSKAEPMEIYDTEDEEENEVEGMIDTDTESSAPPTTRQNSFNSIFTAPSAATSTTSLGTTFSQTRDLGGSRKRSFVDSVAGTSESATNVSPPKIRRTLDVPSTPSSSRATARPLSSLARAATLPLATSERIYPDIVDEDSPFRIRPSPSAHSKSTTELPNHSVRPTEPSTPSPQPVLPKLALPVPPFTAHIPRKNENKLGVSGPISQDVNISFLDEIEISTPADIVSSDAKAQQMMDDKRIAWGVQWEIARGATFHTALGQYKPRWTWSDVTSKRLDRLRGSSAAAAWKVPYVMLDKEIPKKCPSNLEIWLELDREQLALLEGKGRGLGLMGSWQGTPNWYGGQIQQICRLNKGSAGFYLTLEALEKTRSHRFARYMGSRRMLQMRIDTALLQRERDDVIQFLTRDFVVCGRIFRGFTSKEDSVYLIETNRNHQREARDHEGDNLRLSYGDFIQWHNPLDRNSRQAISKWAARWALGLSTSRPVLEFEERNIIVIDDIYSFDVKPGEKAPAEKTMTDGCGFMNGAALTALYKSGVVNLSHRPISARGRCCGAKGMWLLHPTDDSIEPKIWIRLSQKKISLPTPLDRSHQIFELLCPSRVVAPSHLNMQVISNMSHNQVPDQAFSSLIDEDLEAIIKPLTNWSASHLLIGVAKAVHQTGRIHGTRLQRVAPGSTRALGLARDFHREEQIEEADVDEESPFSRAFNAAPPGRCQFSGAPISVHENAYELLAAGFQPLQLEHLYKKMHSITKTSIDASVKQYRITIMQSLEAFILPDPTGDLEEGQIYFRSSQSLADPETGSVFTTLLGDVIVGRNPTRLPSDLQKVIAVDCVALRDYYDVIIFSTKGKRSLASLLAGGDYDGDTAMLFWAKWLVDNFTNSPASDPPSRLVDEMFTRDVKSVTEFSKELERKTRTDAHIELRKLAFMGLVDSKVGLLSNCHDLAVYKHGYGSERAQYVAHVFNTAMDAQKSGLRLEPIAFKKLQRQYGGRRPDCMVHTESSGHGLYIVPESTGAPAKRDVSQTAFVLDHLVETGDVLRNKHLSEFEKLIEGKRWQRDQDLMGPYLEAKRWASVMTKDHGMNKFEIELQALESHIKTVYEAYWKFLASNNQSPTKPTTATAKRQKKNASSNPAKTELARQYVEGPEGQSEFLTRDLARIKASCAYANHSELFAFSVAFRELCQIKVKASGHYVPTIGTMSEAMSVQSSFVRLYDERVDEF